MKGGYTLIKKLEGWWQGDARLYELTEPVQYRGGHLTNYVVVSATVVPGSGPETYMFASDEDGNVLSWGELPGSFRGGLDHKKALVGLRDVVEEES